MKGFYIIILISIYMLYNNTQKIKFDAKVMHPAAL